jgi:hypothetical protein
MICCPHCGADQGPFQYVRDIRWCWVCLYPFEVLWA